MEHIVPDPVPSASARSFGYSWASIEDLDGDGVPEHVIGDPNAKSGGNEVGAVQLTSSATGKAIAYLLGAAHLDAFGRSVTVLDDVDFDGVQDFVVGAPGVDIAGSTGEGQVLVYSGATQQLLYSVDAPITDERVQFGYYVAALEDINGDGATDFAIATPNEANGRGQILALSGADGSLLAWARGSQFKGIGWHLARCHDFDGDGWSDLVCTMRHEVGDDAELIVYSGKDLSFLGSTTIAYSKPRVVGSAGDFNGDGTPDFVISGAKDLNANWGYLYVLSGIDFRQLILLRGSRPNANLGNSAVGVGDWDGDGFDDLAYTYDENFNANHERMFIAVLSGKTRQHLIQRRFHFQRNWRSSRLFSLADHLGDARRELGMFNPNGDRTAVVFGQSEFIESSADELSASAGGSIDFDFHFPVAAAGMTYHLLASASGSGPSFFGVKVPLTYDSLARATIGGDYAPAIATDPIGTLDDRSRGSAQLTLPAGALQALVGRTLTFAAVAYPAGRLAKYSSAARTVTIVP